MGLFSRKKKTYVSSVAYGLGEDDGPGKQEYLKYTVLNANMQGLNVADAITQGYLRGQGLTLRNAFSYARDKYAHGVPVSAAKYLEAPDREELVQVLKTKHPGATIDVLTLVTSVADHEWWAEEYLAREHGYDRTEQRFSRPPAGIHEDASVAYDLEPDGLIRILFMNQTGGGTAVISYRPAGYVKMAEFIHCAYQTVQVFNGAATTETRPSTPGEVDSVSTTVEIVDRAGETQTKTTRITTTVSGSTATVKTTAVTEVRSRPLYFLYRLGAGTYPVLDTWLQSELLTAPYYPAIPLRVDNVDVTAENRHNTPLYKTSKKLLDKVGLSIEELAENINSNDSIGEIDYAFVVFGVSLKVKSQEGKRYLYRYFEHLRGITSPGTTKTSHAAWAALFNTNTSTPPPINAVQIYSARERDKNHDIKLQWDYIDTKLKSGKVSTNARIGDCEISMGGQREEFNFRNLDIVLDSSKLYARRQVTENTYEELEISGLYYENFIYQGKSVSISAYDAFHDDDEEGFIVPLNQQVLRSMSLKDTTDLAYHCMHLVFNCYKVVKQKWYQTGLFKIIVIIIAIVIIVVTWGAGTPAAVSMVAATLTLAGVAVGLAIVLAATLYVLAMMVLMNILAKASTNVFGEKWGPIIAAVIMFVSANWSNIGGAMTGSSTLTAAQVMNATTAVLNAYGHLQNYKAGEVMQDITKLQEEWDKKFDELNQKMEEMLGTNTDLLDIQGMTDATYFHHFESMDQFLSRTLLTGGDICEITSSQITNFVDLGLQLPSHG